MSTTRASRGKHGMAGHEHQREDVVVDLVRIPQHVVGGARRIRGRRTGGRAALAQVAGQGGVPLVTGGTTPERIDRPPTADREAAGRVAGHPSRGQVTKASAKRLLGDVFSQGKSPVL
ncbi:hypothetical protein ACU686_37355 [Yinghuangia aomiensis]